MKFTFVLVSLLASAVAFSLGSPSDSEWKAYKEQHGKSYKPSEDVIRRNMFITAKAKVAEHYEEYLTGQRSYSIALNKFSDYLPYEIENLKGFKKSSVRLNDFATFIAPDKDVVLPSSIDWRIKGAVTPVKDQKQCGSCWAFSSTGGLEGQHFRKTGELVSLSEQQLLDCVTNDDGCNGGIMDDAFNYIKANQGIDTEKSYPYFAKEGKCHYKNTTIGATDTGFVRIHEHVEEDLEKAVATVGPVPIAINARDLSFYKRGIYAPEGCDPDDLNHGVLAVGYGISHGGTPYWIIKNSWGSDWGEKGYFRMKRGVNQCGVAAHAVYPLV